jgi:hypothetical protein
MSGCGCGWPTSSPGMCAQVSIIAIKVEAVQNRLGGLDSVATDHADE